MEKNKVKFGLNKVHWAKITGYDEDGMPIYAAPVRLPGAVDLMEKPTRSMRTTVSTIFVTTTPGMRET